MKTIEELEAGMTTPSDELIRDIRELDGDILLLGIGGKMGPTLGKLAVNAVKEAGGNKRVLGASRLSDSSLREELKQSNATTISCVVGTIHSFGMPIAVNSAETECNPVSAPDVMPKVNNG